MNGGRTVTTRVDRLGAIDHAILSLLQLHRVLTTPQLITLTARPERTVDYRLARLRTRSLVERTRPYAESGSAPYYWWLTRAGARLVEGTSPAPGKGTPNPLFLRHTAAIAGLFVALVDAGPSVGLTLTEWRRDENAWEDWTHYGQAGRIRPDAYVEVDLEVDGHDGRAGAFIEVDFATMDQARLRAKVARHRRYCQETVFWDRHPCCGESEPAPLRNSFVGFRPRTPCSSCIGRARRRAATMTARTRVQIRPESACSLCGGHHHGQRRSMRHHRQVPRCQRPDPARRCRTQRRPTDSGRRRNPMTGRFPEAGETSRIGPPPTREGWGRKAAGQGRDRARRRDPDCWGRMQLIVFRLIGGRR